MAFNAGDKVNCSTWTQVGFKAVNYTITTYPPLNYTFNCSVVQSLHYLSKMIGENISSSLPSQARMERDMSARRIYGEEETPEGGAGSEFGKKQREEARRKKFGIVTREFKVEDQPWILKVNGKAGKRCVCGVEVEVGGGDLMHDFNSDYLFFFICQVQRSKEGWCYRKRILLHLHTVSGWRLRGLPCPRLVQLHARGEAQNSHC